MFKDANKIGVEIQKNINTKYEEEILKIQEKIEEARKNTKFEFFVSGPISKKIIEELEAAHYTVEYCGRQGENDIKVKIPKPNYNI